MSLVNNTMLLVTTAIEQTWGHNQDILFLGEWCKLYNRKEIWSKRNFNVLPYHWNDRNKLKKDFYYLQNLNKLIITELTFELNELHGVNYSERYWNILLGFWLNLFTAVVFDRWSMIKSAVDSGKVEKSFELDIPSDYEVANDATQFNNLIIDDLWNHSICTKLIKRWTEIPLEIVIHSSSFDFSNKFEISKTQEKTFYKRFLRIISDKVFSAFTSGDDVLMIGTYLPLFTEIELQIRLGQIPIKRLALSVPRVKFNSDFRQWKLITNRQNDLIGNIIRSLIPEQLPKVYLEGYNELNKMCEKLNWPSNPKFIFTSVSHFSDVGFQTWAAKKIEDGSKLITADHGGFGSNAFNASINYQLSISDASLSWGWDDTKYPNVKPIGILKTFGKKQLCERNGFGLMVQVAMPRYSFDLRAMPIGEQMLQYYNDQFLFFDCLPQKIQKKMLIRLYLSDYGWNQKKRWKDRFPIVQLDEGKLPITKLIEKSRIVISTYNATTHIESLSLNLPSLIFWNPNFWELHSRAIPYYKRLKEVGIFHETPESAALKLNEIWDDVFGWWNQKEIQGAKNDFCFFLAKEVKNPITVLKKVLTVAKK